MKRLNPYVVTIFFLMVAILTVICRHPLFVGISLIFAFINSVMEGRLKTLKFNLLFIIPVMLVTAAINPLFNHRGVTVLSRFPSGNPLTLESIIYGLFSGLMLGAVVSWFSYHNKIMTSDKLCYIFGRMIPSLSLLFTMTLRFVPLMGNKLKSIIISRKCLCMQPDSEYVSNKNTMASKIKEGLRITSVMVDRGLETAITTSDSMRSRGYGCGKRSFFSIFRFSANDGLILAALLIMLVYITIGTVNGCLDFQYYPSIKYPKLTPYSISVFIVFVLLCAMPLFLKKYESRNQEF